MSTDDYDDASPWLLPFSPWRAVSPDRYPVGDSPDLRRVTALPRRPVPDLDGPTGAALVELTTRRFGRPRASGTCSCKALAGYCLDRPWAVQAWALHEMSVTGGLFAPIVVGGGKTFLNILAALAVPECRNAVCLIPPNLREQFKAHYLLAAEHWRVPSVVLEDWYVIQEGQPVLSVVPYSVFSRPKATDLLERLNPDLVIADEGHKLSNRETATAGRVFRYWARHPNTRFCAWSGSFARDSLCNFAGLVALALREGSPLPLDHAVADEWALAVDPVAWPSPPGKLGERLGLPVRDGLRRRVVETVGVVSSPGVSGTRVRLYERRPPPVPQVVDDALRLLRRRRERPDGVEFIEDFEVARCAQELSCGFYYRWVFPRGEPEELIAEWRAARKNWNSEVREKLARRRPHLDSPHLCERAAMRAWGDIQKADNLPEWRAESWTAWRDVRHLVEPKPGDPVWLDDWLARDAAAWTTEHRGVVWYRHTAFGARVAELAGLPLHAGGPGSEFAILAERGDRSIVASAKAHGTGRDGLQRVFSVQLIANSMKSGADWEQLLGRLDRPGQTAEVVPTWWYGHTLELREAMSAATGKAEFIRDTLHGAQKLTSAHRAP